MTDDPTREQHRAAPDRATAPKPRPRIVAKAVLGAFTGTGVLIAIGDVMVGAPWYDAAGAALVAIVAAVFLGRVIHVEQRHWAMCRDEKWLGGEPAFVCERRRHHRGDHREDNVSWTRDGGPSYAWRGRPTR
jgi:membrane protein implicated in regulation of membrane protease activity